MKLMTIQNDKIDEFYKNYVNDICMKVEEKAELEFEYIWNEHQKTGIDNCVISDKFF
jgi:glutamate dehydrogenase